MFRAILNANEHGEPVSVGFPISKSAYADTITKLQQRSMGDVVNQDCRVEKIISSTANWTLHRWISQGKCWCCPETL